jgi:hypothetical protein
VRSRTAGVMTTLMRNGRDCRWGKPVTCHARKERVFLLGTRSADHIRASGHNGCIQRPDTLMQDRSPPARQNPLATHGRTIHLGQTRKSQRATGKSASPSGTDIVYRTCQVRNVPTNGLLRRSNHRPIQSPDRLSPPGRREYGYSAT